MRNAYAIMTAVALIALGVAGTSAARAASLPPLPHTVGMSGPDVDLIESGIAAYERRDFRAARDDFRRALAIRAWTAIANFDLGVAEIHLGDRVSGKRHMQRGFALANAHGMASSPQANRMKSIAAMLRISL